MSLILPERQEVFFQRFPLLLPTLTALNEAQIPFAIGGSGCLFLLGNERVPDDVDIYLPDDRHDLADRLFGIESYPYVSATENVRNSNPENDHSIQLTSHLVMTIVGKKYVLSLTSDVLAHRQAGSFQGQTFFLFPPEDVLLIKALQRRGPDVGKHDLADIDAFLHVYSAIDSAYLRQRIQSLHAEDRVGTSFDHLA